MYLKPIQIVIEKSKRTKKIIKKWISLQHSYPHSWRSKAPLIYRATSSMVYFNGKKFFKK